MRRDSPDASPAPEILSLLALFLIATGGCSPGGAADAGADGGPLAWCAAPTREDCERFADEWGAFAADNGECLTHSDCALWGGSTTCDCDGSYRSPAVTRGALPRARASFPLECAAACVRTFHFVGGLGGICDVWHEARCEAGRCVAVTVGNCLPLPDGGVDASVDAASPPDGG